MNILLTAEWIRNVLKISELMQFLLITLQLIEYQQVNNFLVTFWKKSRKMCNCLNIKEL